MAPLNTLEATWTSESSHSDDQTLCLYLCIQKQQSTVRTQNLDIWGWSVYCPPCSSNIYQKHRLLSIYLPWSWGWVKEWMAIATNEDWNQPVPNAIYQPSFILEAANVKIESRVPNLSLQSFSQYDRCLGKEMDLWSLYSAIFPDTNLVSVYLKVPSIWVSLM